MSNGVGLNWKRDIFAVVMSLTVIQTGIWFFYYRPILKQERWTNVEDSLAVTRQQLELTKRQFDEAIRQRDQGQKTIDDMRQKWQVARNKFIAEVGQDIKDALKTEAQWEARPHPTVVQIAQKLVSDRGAARQRLLQIEDDVQRIYYWLDSEIDGIRNRLNQTPPPTDGEMLELIRQLATPWNDKVRDVNETVEDLLLLLSCPQVVASNP